MRTTLTIDEDVAARLKRLRREREVNFKTLVNEVLRRGLREMSAAPQRRRALRTRAFDMGKPLINIDNVAEGLAHLEGEAFK
ncbi:MAG: CopG family transcriptional regulator [Gemmataceae bacterium]